MATVLSGVQAASIDTQAQPLLSALSEWISEILQVLGAESPSLPLGGINGWKLQKENSTLVLVGVIYIGHDKALDFFIAHYNSSVASPFPTAKP